MDFELAAWQMTYLVIAPRRVYRNVYYHKQTKNTWARDDPAIIVMISGCLCVSALLWSALYIRPPLLDLPIVFLLTSFRMVFFDFLLLGLIISFSLWALSNRLLLSRHTSSDSNQTVEFPYAFDIHCNAFFPTFLTLYIAQFVLAPIVIRQNWVCLFVGNTGWLIALTQYTYITYLGINALPFVQKSEILLIPIIIFFLLYVVSLLGFNISRAVLGLYFGMY